ITLKNLTPKFERKKGKWSALYYLHRDSLETLYKDRKRFIYSIYEQASQNEKDFNLATALQLYYYSGILINSLPMSSLEYKGEELVSEITIRIQEILSGVSFEYEGDAFIQDDVRDIKLNVNYKGKPVELLEFTYQEDNDQVTIVARGGKAVCRLTGATTSYKSLDVDISYMFSDRKEQFKEVNQLWYAVNKPDYPESGRKIKLGKRKKKSKKYDKQALTLNLNNTDDCQCVEGINQRTKEFITWLKFPKDVGEFTQDKFLQNKLNETLKCNNIKVTDKAFTANLNKTFEGWEVRNIPVLCSYPSLNKHSYEYLVLDFDKAGVLQDVNFTVFNELFDSKAADFKKLSGDTYQKRHILIKFLEKYRSAYLNRDIKTLEKIFSDDAVIIVGRNLPKGKLHRDVESSVRIGQPDTEYTEMNKNQFMLRQQIIFNAQRDIHLGFNSCNVGQKNNDDDVYGISMRQQYASTGYSDEGYLFLLVDFNGKEPMIYVRTWQPQEWDEEALYDLTNYEIKK
ncbi:MAG: hypothetical protein P9L91_04385, partial [Candidatus Zophobacter franzmannii]|nr:hypothetical protein [Candidatus Zophobacter franzmannii]